ncbi:MAG: J domain-containing protein [Myxococcota bacterium]
MDPRLRARVEIETIHELLPELNCYQLLMLAPDCAQNDVDAAFRNESRRLHPDRNSAGADPDFRNKANAVFKAVNDAYRTLRDPDARARYDQQMREGALRMTDEARKAAESEAAAKNDPAKAARTPKGEKHWKMALQCMNDEDFNGAVMQINFAIQFEPQNETFREWLGKAKQANEEKKRGKGSGAGYKIRL